MNPSFDAPLIPGLDTRTALMRLGGSQELFDSLLKPIASAHDDTLAVVRLDLEAGRHAQAANQLHALRGSLSNIGDESVSALALELEQAIKQGAVERFDQYLDRLDTALQRLLADIGRYLAESDLMPVADSEPSTRELDPAALADLILALKTSNASAIDEFETLYPALKARLDPTSAEQLRTLMDHLRFKETAALLTSALLTPLERSP